MSDKVEAARPCYLSPSLVQGLRMSGSWRERTNTGTRMISLCVIGDKATGKTSLAYRLTQNFFKEHTTSTLGGQIYSVRHTDTFGQQCVLNVRDTSGDEAFRSVIPVFYRGVEMAILVFDLTCRTSFNSLSYWASTLRKNDSNILHTLVLCGTKLDIICDDGKKREVTYEEGAAMASKLGCVTYFETSAKTGMNSMAIKNLITEEALKDDFPNGGFQDSCERRSGLSISERTAFNNTIDMDSRKRCDC